MGKKRNVGKWGMEKILQRRVREKKSIGYALSHWVLIEYYSAMIRVIRLIQKEGKTKEERRKEKEESKARKGR